MDRILTIIKKELRDLVRDRRTMFFMVIFPAVIIPLLIGGVTQLSISFAVGRRLLPFFSGLHNTALVTKISYLFRSKHTSHVRLT